MLFGVQVASRVAAELAEARAKAARFEGYPLPEMLQARAQEAEAAAHEARAEAALLAQQVPDPLAMYPVGHTSVGHASALLLAH